MRDDAIGTWRDRAVAAGLLPSGATTARDAERPWPVLLLTAVGGWLAAVLLLISTGMLLYRWLAQDEATYLAGGGVLLASLALLRRRRLPLFLEQLATPLLALGVGLTGYALVRDLDDAAGASLTALLCAGLAFALPQAWLRLLLGGVTAGLLAWAGTETGVFGLRRVERTWWCWTALLALWLPAQRLQARLTRAARAPALAAVLEAFGAGWLLTLAGGLCLWSGQTFLLGAGLGLDGSHAGLSGWSNVTATPPYGSVLLAAVAGYRLAQGWPSLRQPAFYVSMAVTLWLAWAAPALGPVLLALALCLLAARWRLAVACALAALWIVGSVYYQLSWSLLHKALVLLAAAAVLGLTARLARPAPAPGPRAAPAATPRRVWGLWLGLAATPLLVNVSILHKESLIARGRPIFIALEPVDPRSLMQGDYMRLNFVPLQALDLPQTGRSATLLLRIDARGVATPRSDTGGAPAADEVRLPLKREGGRWILVTDAWSFREGEAARWAAARYGEFRVDGRGGALLVGLRDERLRPL